MLIPPTFNIDEIVILAQEGDKDAFEKLYDYFFEPIYRYVYFRVPESEVDDITETIFIKVWTHLDTYEKKDVQFSSWIFRIAHNTVVDHFRSHRSLSQIPEDIVDKSLEGAPSESTEQSLLKNVVREAVDELKEPYKQVVTLKFLMGFSNNEIADILHEREGNIRLLQFRALKELKKILERKGVKEFSLPA